MAENVTKVIPNITSQGEGLQGVIQEEEVAEDNHQGRAKHNR